MSFGAQRIRLVFSLAGIQGKASALEAKISQFGARPSKIKKSVSVPGRPLKKCPTQIFFLFLFS